LGDGNDIGGATIGQGDDVVDGDRFIGNDDFLYQKP